MREHLFYCVSLSLSLSLSLCFNSHFSGESRFASFIGAKDDGGGGDNWSTRCAKLQSNRHHQQTNAKVYTGQMPFLSPINSVEALKATLEYSEQCKNYCRIKIIKNWSTATDNVRRGMFV